MLRSIIIILNALLNETLDNVDSTYRTKIRSTKSSENWIINLNFVIYMGMNYVIFIFDS